MLLDELQLAAVALLSRGDSVRSLAVFDAYVVSWLSSFLPAYLDRSQLFKDHIVVI